METVRPISLPKTKNTRSITLEDVYVPIRRRVKSKYQDQCNEKCYYLKRVGSDEKSPFYESVNLGE